LLFVFYEQYALTLQHAQIAFFIAPHCFVASQWSHGL